MKLESGYDPYAQGRQIDGIISEVKKWTLEQITPAISQLREEFLSQQPAIGNTDSGWNDFHKQSQYLDMLIRVHSSTDHKVHEEITEAIKRLKEITYA